jgi:methylase of polypeptide subunit release factors
MRVVNQKSDLVCTNPPYMPAQNMAPDMSAFMRKLETRT